MTCKPIRKLDISQSVASPQCIRGQRKNSGQRKSLKSQRIGKITTTGARIYQVNKVKRSFIENFR